MSEAPESSTARLLERTRHVCFDKDGTLTDVHPYWSHICGLRAGRLTERYGLARADTTALLERMGIDTAADRIKPEGPVGYRPRRVIIEAVRSFLAERGAETSAEDIAALFKDVDRLQQETGDYRLELLPQVREFLGTLKGRGIAMTIYTSDRKENTDRVMRTLSLDSYFAGIVGGGCVERPKPDPEGFLTACRLAGSPPSESVYIGDTVEDMKMAAAGKAGGAIGVATGLSGIEELRRLTPHACAGLKEILA